jgi:protein AIR1/2
MPHSWDFPKEPSAFSTYNNMSGPFFDPGAEPPEYQARYHNHGDGSRNEDVPNDVGRQGRKRARAKLEKSFEEQQQQNGDQGDWFSNPLNARSRVMQPASSSRTEPHTSKKLIFGASVKEAGRHFQPLPAPERPKLIDRIQGGDVHNNHQSRHTNRRGPPHDNLPRNPSHKRSRNDDPTISSSGRHARDRDRDDSYNGRRREGDRVHRREDRGPRYTGGYSR